VNYERIDDAGLHITVDGKATTLPVDTIVVCAGQESRRELLAPLQAAGIPVTLIGGADVAAELDAKRAIDQGTRVARHCAARAASPASHAGCAATQPMPRKAEAGLEPNRRAELLRAAARLFVEKGFDATTTRDIADAVGMRSGSPFYHFRSKQELLKTAMVEGLDAGYARLLAAIDGITDPEQRLRVLVRTHLGTLLEGECHAPMLLGETRALDAAAHAEIAAAFDRYQVPWQEPLDELQHSRQARFGSGAGAAAAVWHAQLESKHWYRPDGKLSLDELADAAVAMLLRAPKKGHKS
jgi:AcrR family transcriptional regulator